MNYDVFGGTLSLTQSINHKDRPLKSAILTFIVFYNMILQ